ncbi:class I SAM-dependent methyltransferase [Mangrovimonas sp. YM274]|uniref:class I SAM-dependent methyltransferase n=1 Tax=Mangrovimonas sp. YM274 TaxID=3070660 RepID=UPI0027DB852A|nr:class I SAM-dependent methyltransferase [Mangrovimonas sp. YM274]WMI69319.1 class I SAM-dependent methyltransferase [Mangrovimonas sp. YM274]
MHCTLCDSQLNQKADAYYFICHTCGAFVMDKLQYFTTEQEKAHYESHNNDVNDPGYQTFTSPITNAILKAQTPEHLGLDYGCGSGPVITKMLQEQQYQVNLFDPYFYPDQSYKNHRYDYIFSCEVFEHFYHPKQEIAQLVGLLQPEGRLYIMTHLYQGHPDFNTWYYRKDATHVFIYTEQTMRYIADTFNLVIESLGERMTVFRKLS